MYRRQLVLGIVCIGIRVYIDSTATLNVTEARKPGLKVANCERSYMWEVRKEKTTLNFCNGPESTANVGVYFIISKLAVNHGKEALTREICEINLS